MQTTGGIIRSIIRAANSGTGSDERQTRWAWLLLVVVTIASSTRTFATEPSDSSASRGNTYPNQFKWDFSRQDDRDFNGWPDEWKRRLGPGYPRYVSISTAAKNPDFERQALAVDTELIRLHRLLDRWSEGVNIPLPPSLTDLLVDRYLRADLNGGLVSIESPPVPTSGSYQYQFRCRIKTEGLRHDQVTATLVFLDKANKKLTSYSTDPVSGSTDWKLLTIDRIKPPAGAKRMVVRLDVRGSVDGLEDIRGSVGLDDVAIQKFPQLSLTTDRPMGIYPTGRGPIAIAKILGLPAGEAKLRFSLKDRNDREKASALKEIPSRDGEGIKQAAFEEDSTDLAHARLQWQLPRLDPGFYTVEVSLLESERPSLRTETTLAVIDELVQGPPHGSFGWTLPDGLKGVGGTGSVRPRDLGPWLAALNVAWVKFPCWIHPGDTTKADEVASTLSKYQDVGIQTIGMLDAPPSDQIERYDIRGHGLPQAADLFRDIKLWQPLLEPVMTRLTLKVKVWQLGADRDHSFLGQTRLRESIRKIATGLQGFGQPIDIAISWPWLEPQPAPAETSWQAVCRSADPNLIASELDAFLEHEDQQRGGGSPRNWLLLDPAPKGYGRDQRIQDLVHRMATVSRHNVQAAFISDPRNPEHGLLRPDGRPGEMLLPWRTTSRLLGNLDHIGSLKLRSGAENLVFARRDRAVVVVWAPQQKEELIYLGPQAKQIDVWGNSFPLPIEEYGGHPVHRVTIGPMPTFLVGVDPALIAFRMSVELEQQQIDSLLSVPQRISIRFSNPTSGSLSGEVQVRSPDDWSIKADSPHWELFRGRDATQDFDVLLGNNAAVGLYELPINFRFRTTPPTEITVYRKLRMGPEGLELDVQTELAENGDLRVRLEMTNRTDQSSTYDCFLFPGPGRDFQRRILTVSAGKTVLRVFRWSNGRELLGRTIRLRAVEQQSRRVLNYAIPVKP